MPSMKRMRELARRLVAHESDAALTPLHSEAVTVRVYERLRRQLGTSVGNEGFQALASRALTLAKSESPWLSEVQVTEQGALHGLGDDLTRAGEAEEGGIALIAQLLTLFLAFLGEATTLRLIEDLRYQVEVNAAPSALDADAAGTMAAEPIMALTFQGLLREITRLRSVSEQIERLAGMHADMEDGLMSAAGSIRGIATVLDIFTLIRSQVGDSLETRIELETNRYVN